MVRALFFLALVPALVFGSGSGLPIPRFVSLRSSEVNMRVGPGNHFPMEWIYQRAYLPMEVTAEFGDWRKVRDMDGTQGWIHRSLLTGRRHVVVLRESLPMHVSDDQSSRLIAKLQAGVIGKILKSKGEWCYIQTRQAQSLKGWVLKKHIWGISRKDP